MDAVRDGFDRPRVSFGRALRSILPRRQCAIACLAAIPHPNAKTLRYQLFRAKFRKGFPSRKGAVPSAYLKRQAGLRQPFPLPFVTGSDEGYEPGRDLAPMSGIAIKATRDALERTERAVRVWSMWRHDLRGLPEAVWSIPLAW